MPAISLLDSAGGACYDWFPFVPFWFGLLFRFPVLLFWLELLFRSPVLPLREGLACWVLCLGVGLCLEGFFLVFFFWLPWLVSVGGGLCPPRCFGFGLWVFCGLVSVSVGDVGAGDLFLWLFCLRALAFWCFSTVLMMVSSRSFGVWGYRPEASLIALAVASEASRAWVRSM